MKLHYPYHKTDLNGVACGNHGTSVVTCHIAAVTCARCRRIMARRGLFGCFVFLLALEHARIRLTFSR